MQYYDIIIVGTGISGLYSAHLIQQFSPHTSFLLLEKYKKNWIGGRTSNDTFYGAEVVTGAGIGRRSKDKWLYALLTSVLKLPTHEFEIDPHYSALMPRVNVSKVVARLRKAYHKHKSTETFKDFGTRVLGEKAYKQFTLNVGYTDYEMEDVFETLYYYGLEDNMCCWKAFHVPWKKMVEKLYSLIGEKHFRFSSKVVQITKLQNPDHPCQFQIALEGKNTLLYCNKVIVASTIDTIRTLIPKPIYQDIMGQPFMRLYAKFSAKSIPIMKRYVKDFTFVPGPLQRIIPMDPSKGVYMIAYNDNANTLALKPYRENTRENRSLYETLLERSLGIPDHSLHIVAIKDYYWPIGTHYYCPLDKRTYASREDFIDQAQHPEKGMLVVGEAVSRNQGWTEGALQSVRAVVTKQWVNTNFC